MVEQELIERAETKLKFSVDMLLKIITDGVFIQVERIEPTQDIRQHRNIDIGHIFNDGLNGSWYFVVYFHSGCYPVRFYFDDYGKTWAFAKGEIENTRKWNYI